MDQILSNITNVIGEDLLHAVMGLVILIVGLLVAKFIGGILAKGLKKISFLEKANLIAPLISLVKAVLTIFVLMAVLQHFGLTDVLQPLQDMVRKFLAAVPNIIGAGVIAYAGWVIAKIVSELVGVALGKADEQIALRTGNNDLKVSKFGSAFIFGGILLPIIVAALGVLNIAAISEPATAMIKELMGAVPNIVAAGIILLVTYFVAKFVVYM